MRYFKIILICILALSILGSCKSVDSLLKDGEYQEAYNFATTVDDKNRVVKYMIDQEKYDEAYNMVGSIDERDIIIKQMIDNNKYREAMHLLSKEYDKIGNSNPNLKNDLVELFLKNVKVTSSVDSDYGDIAFAAYVKLDYNSDYDKKWTLLCMSGSSNNNKEIFLYELIKRKGFVNLTYSSDVVYRKYKWVDNTLRHRIEQFLRNDYSASTKKEEKSKRLNALNQITDILVKYGTSNYIDDWGCGKKGEYYNESVPLVDIVINGNKHNFYDNYGKIETKNVSFTLEGRNDCMIGMNLYDSDRNNILYKPSVVPNANYWAYQSMNNTTNVYFENITKGPFIKSLIDTMKKEYQ